MKLLNREPTEEMLLAHFRLHQGREEIWKVMYDAAPEIKVDMEPVAWILPTDPVRIVDHMSFNANYGGTVKELYSADQLAALQAENERLLKEVEELKTIRGNSVLVPSNELAALQAENERLGNGWHESNCAALEAALKAERIKTLEEVLVGLRSEDDSQQLRAIIASITELKEQS